MTKRGVDTAVLAPIDRWSRLKKMTRPDPTTLLLSPDVRTDALAPPRRQARVVEQPPGAPSRGRRERYHLLRSQPSGNQGRSRFRWRSTRYLTFDGDCREAFEFHRSVFGGEFQTISTFADAPYDVPAADEEKDRILHVSLPVGSSVQMGSDRGSFAPPGSARRRVSLQQPVMELRVAPNAARLLSDKA